MGRISGLVLSLCGTAAAALLSACGALPNVSDTLQTLGEQAADVSARLRMLDEETAVERKDNAAVSRAVVDSFSSGDAEGLKALLSPKSQGIWDIDEQILAAFDFFEGTVLSYDEKHLSGSEKGHTEYGRTTQLSRSWVIRDIQTDAGKVYSISLGMYVTYRADPDREGIFALHVREEGVEESPQIGVLFPWRGGTGANLINNALQALGNNSAEDLKALFSGDACTQSGNMDEQIAQALAFFEGVAVDDKWRDFDTTFTDDIVVKDYAIWSVAITSILEEIETDAGRTYAVELHANVKNPEKSAEGVTLLTITDENGGTVTIS